MSKEEGKELERNKISGVLDPDNPCIFELNLIGGGKIKVEISFEEDKESKSYRLSFK